jgi:hypothetical protein
MGQINLALAVAISFSLEVLLLWIFDGDAAFFWLSVVWTGLIVIAMTMAWAILDLVRQSKDEAVG